MGQEINLLSKYPKSKRNLDERSAVKNEKIRSIARKFGKEFFDGDRNYGYGGFNYHPKFWQPVVPDFINYWNLDDSKSLLDVGCAKGFMLYDLKLKIPGLKIQGIDISKYAIENSKEDVRKYLSVANATNLPFPDNSFDVVISINTIHNLDEENCGKALKEISRVSKKNSFITVDAYRNDIEREQMFKWNLTAKTIMSVEKWKEFFKKHNYNGDYYWFIP